MVEEIIRDFCDTLAAYGAPVSSADIIADDARHRVASTLDKKRQKTVTYQLKVVDGEFGVGWFHSFKHGVSAGQTITYISKQPRRLTPEERLAWKERAAIQKELQRARANHKLAVQKRAAMRLKSVVFNYPLADSAHPYLERKKVAAHGLRYRQKDGALLVPVYKTDGLIWSVQKVYDNGKYFLSGASIEGGYYPITTPAEDKHTLIICEGFATGATLREVTGLPVVVAFNAGNMLSAAVALRKRYPDARFILAADNDRYRKDGNIGIEKATIAAKEVGGVVVVPDFPAEDANGTDWNDYVIAHGDSQLRDKMQAVLSPARASSEPSDVVSKAAACSPAVFNGDWRDELLCDEDGILLKGKITNAQLFIQNHDDLSGVFRENLFEREIYVAREPIWHSGEFHPHRVTDTDVTSCAALLERYGVDTDVNKTMKAIAVVAQRNGFHPAREYFEGLVWDGDERLSSWLTYYMGAEDDDAEYLSFIGTKWLVAAVKRVYEPGCKFDHVLVMEGTQGRGKSTALECMATFGSDKEEAYFTDNIKISDIQSKDTILLLQGSIIVELAELAGFSKKDDEEIKGWITLKMDRCRKPYDRTVTHFPRQFVLAATTNNYDYLKDPTGNRRYWPFKSSAVDIDGIKAVREQLWAEAVHWYRRGLYIGPTEEEMALAEAAQEKRRTIDTWEDDVLNEAVALTSYTGEGFTTRDVLRNLGFELKDQTYQAQKRVSSILQTAGYENRVVKVSGKSKRQWVKL